MLAHVVERVPVGDAESERGRRMLHEASLQLERYDSRTVTHSTFRYVAREIAIGPTSPW